MDNIKELANYCLGCINKPCSQKGCPMHTEISEFIKKVKEENIEEAYNILSKNNICSHICSIVCPQEIQCEGSCIRGIKQTPTQIGKLEKYVNEWAEENGIVYKYEKKEANNKKVAVIGSGPSGISVAFELVMAGFSVGIFEKESVFGGLLTYGIPDFRLKKSLVDDVKEKLVNLGVNIYYNKELGKDFSIDDIKNDYDAIYVGIGAPISSMYKLSEEETENSIYDSDSFIRAYSSKNFINSLDTVVIVGGGNVAMDASRVALKMGAKKIKILYRRDRVHMPANQSELDDAILEGVEFKELTRVDSANIENGKIVSLNCVPTKIVDGKATDDDEKERFIEEASQVVFAIGLKPDKNLIEKNSLELNDWGYLKTDENGRTSMPKVYAGGDVASNDATVCKALASGRKAAFSIIEDLK